MSHQIYLSPPHPGGQERAFVDDAFATNWLAPLGPNVDAFEAGLCQVTGAGHALGLSSGTAALHLAMVLLGVGPGDEVICPTLTFAASANPIVYEGARPGFVDSDPKTWNLCPEALEAALRDRPKRPRAVIAVDLYGMPAAWDKLEQVCARYEVPLVEDAAEALGARFGQRACGSLGRLSVLSFNGNKIITTSGGGALLSDDEALIRRARRLASQAREPVPHYEHREIGYNYRLSNVCAGIGRGQLVVLAERVRQRRAHFAAYRAALGESPGIHFQEEPDGCFSNRWLTVITLNPELHQTTPEALSQALAAEGIEARPVWKPLHRQPVFRDCPVYATGVADRLFATGLCLPSGSAMTEAQREQVVTVLKQKMGDRRPPISH